MYTSEIGMLLEGTKNELVQLVEVFKRNDDVACFHRKQTRPTVKLIAGQSAIQRKTADNVVKRAAYVFPLFKSWADSYVTL